MPGWSRGSSQGSNTHSLRQICLLFHLISGSVCFALCSSAAVALTFHTGQPGTGQEARNTAVSFVPQQEQDLAPSCVPSSLLSSTHFSFQPIVPSSSAMLLLLHLYTRSPHLKHFEFKFAFSSLQKQLFSVPSFVGLWVNSKEDSQVRALWLLSVALIQQDSFGYTRVLCLV